MCKMRLSKEKKRILPKNLKKKTKKKPSQEPAGTDSAQGRRVHVRRLRLHRRPGGPPRQACRGEAQVKVLKTS